MPIPEDIYKKIVRAKVFIDQNYAERINLDAISGEAPGEFRESSRQRRTAATEQPRVVIPYCFIEEVSGEKSNNEEGKLERMK